MNLDKIDAWLAGFFSAEGYIGNNIGESEQRAGFSYHPFIKIAQSEDNILYSLAGFLEGDMCINSGVNRHPLSKIDYSINPHITVAQKFSNILEFIKAYLEIKGINSTLIKYKKTKKNYYMLSIYGLENVKKFLNLIFPYMLGSKKLQAHILLEEIIPRIEKGFHLTKEGFFEIMGYVDKMNELKGGRRGKYNQKYFSKIWNMPLRLRERAVQSDEVSNTNRGGSSSRTCYA